MFLSVIEAHGAAELGGGNPEQERQSSWEGTPNKSRQQQIAEELMAVRLREAESLAELKSMKQKVISAFALNQISNIVVNRDTNTNEEKGL